MYKAVIFDLDGTLADTVESIAYAMNKALELYQLAPQPIESYKYFAGDGADVLVKRALFAAGDTEGKFYEKAFKEYKAFFEKDCTYQVKPFDGIVTTLNQLKEKNIKIAVVSNKPHLRAVHVVEELFGKGFFDYIIGQIDGIPKKPDPTSTFIAAKEMNVETKECIYIGDTNVDMETGNAAGMLTVGVLWGFRTREELEKHNAHVIVENPEKILDIL